MSIILSSRPTSEYNDLDTEVKIASLLWSYFYDVVDKKSRNLQQYIPTYDDYSVPTHWKMEAKDARKYLNNPKSRVYTIYYNNCDSNYDSELYKKDDKQVLGIIEEYANAYENKTPIDHYTVAKYTLVSFGRVNILFVKPGFLMCFHEHNKKLFKKLDGGYFTNCVLAFAKDKEQQAAEYNRSIKFIKDYYAQRENKEHDILKAAMMQMMPPLVKTRASRTRDHKQLLFRHGILHLCE
jgi:hypothetical protein